MAVFGEVDEGEVFLDFSAVVDDGLGARGVLDGKGDNGIGGINDVTIANDAGGAAVKIPLREEGGKGDVVGACELGGKGVGANGSARDDFAEGGEIEVVKHDAFE